MTAKKIIYLASGVFAGTFFFSTVRTFFYIQQGYQPNMSPFMFIIFSPIVSLIIALTSITIESILARITQKSYSGFLEAFVIGLSYTSVLIFLIAKWMILLFIFFNPITVHFFWAYKNKTASC